MRTTVILEPDVAGVRRALHQAGEDAAELRTHQLRRALLHPRRRLDGVEGLAEALAERARLSRVDLLAGVGDLGAGEGSAAGPAGHGAELVAHLALEGSGVGARDHAAGPAVAGHVVH